MTSNYEHVGNYGQVVNTSGQPGYTPPVNLPHGSLDPVAPGPKGYRRMNTINGRTGQAYTTHTANVANGVWRPVVDKIANPRMRDHIGFLLGIH
jgi:hypothetical protein